MKITSMLIIMIIASIIIIMIMIIASNISQDENVAVMISSSATGVTLVNIGTQYHHDDQIMIILS